MEKYIFTFGSDHLLGQHYQPIYAKSASAARVKMLSRYGEDWAFQYTEEEWEKWEKTTKRLGIIIERELNPIYCKEV